MSPQLHWENRETLWEMINEHGYCSKDSMIYNPFSNCKGMNYLVDLLNINNNSAEHKIFHRKSFGGNTVKESTYIIDKATQ